MGIETGKMTNVMYAVIGEDGQVGEMVPMGASIEATINSDVEIEYCDPIPRDFEPFEWSGEIVLEKPWMLFGHPYEDKLLASERLTRFFKSIALPRMAIYKMAEGMEKLEQIREQKNSRRWDFI